MSAKLRGLRPLGSIYPKTERIMKIGTKSLMFGAHCIFIHPLLVAAAWWRLYGFPSDPRLWLAFIVHDWGYWGKSNMDGPEGETHVEAGARIMARLFGPAWGDFTRYHSRYYARKDGVAPSRLCYADKLSLCFEWDWCYLLRVCLTGEIREYRAHAARGGKYAKDSYLSGAGSSRWEWLRTVKRFMLRYVATNY